MKHGKSAGYTLVEVMVGVLISSIGIAGISLMQTAAVRGNQDAYESTVATNLARTWLERVKRDALLWSTAGNPNVGTLFAGRPVPGSSYFVPDGKWSPPRGLPHGVNQHQESSGADYHGLEMGSPRDPLNPTGAKVGPADTHYCVNLRFNIVQTDQAGATVAMGVDARVYWARRGSLGATSFAGMVPIRADSAGCDNLAYAYDDAQMLAAMSCQLAGASNYCLRVHYLRTIVRMVPGL